MKYYLYPAGTKYIKAKAVLTTSTDKVEINPESINQACIAVGAKYTKSAVMLAVIK